MPPFAGFRLVIADHALGLPVLRTLSLCTCCRHYPGAAAGRTLRSASPSRISLPPKGCRVGLRIVLFEDCSAFHSRSACTLALSPIRDTLIEGFSHFVTSMTAPIASGWSGAGWGSHPLESAAFARRTPTEDIRPFRRLRSILLYFSLSVPVVFAGVVDPVSAGYVASLARPGGNANGFLLFEYGVSGKWLALHQSGRPPTTPNL